MLPAAIPSADVHSVLDNLVSGLVILALGIVGGAVRRHARAVETKLERVAADVVNINEATRTQVGTELDRTRRAVGAIGENVRHLGERTAHLEGVLGVIPGHPSGNARGTT